ncbi:hypothetical protein F4779DRAFT_600956 [Xylariaceae sp. FL0662B]|nr:hypothetical protein F4779DRAFT_600956 [Xylariaceae sp. FL0662B]
MTRFFLGRALETSRLAHRVLVSRRSIGTKYHRKIESNHPSSYVEASKSTAIYTYMSDVVLDSGVLSSCKKLNLSLPTELRGLRVKWKSNPRKLGATFSPNHCLNRTAMKYLDRYEHPFRKSILEIYFAKHKAPLWYNAWVGGALVSPFPSSRARKKIEHALRDALAAYGYDRDGRKLKTEEPSAVAELYGTLNIGCQDPLAVCNSKFADLLEDAKVIIGRANPL